LLAVWFGLLALFVALRTYTTRSSARPASTTPSVRAYRAPGPRIRLSHDLPGDARQRRAA
jgi:hypothetical protein